MNKGVLVACCIVKSAQSMKKHRSNTILTFTYLCEIVVNNKCLHRLLVTKIGYEKVKCNALASTTATYSGKKFHSGTIKNS